MELTLTQLRQNLDRLNVEQVVESVYDQTKEQLADLNTRQLTEGFTTAGGRFPGYVLPEYAQLKRSMNPLPGLGNPDLKLTGEFHSSIEASYQGGRLEIRSTIESTDKVQQLEQWYGPDRIYGLTPDNRRLHVEENVAPVLADEIERATGLTVQR